MRRFLIDEGLPITYKQQMVDYILNVIGQSSALAPVSSVNVDPFTGTGAYVPGASSFPAPGTSSSLGDPFTGVFLDIHAHSTGLESATGASILRR
jgi:hypothetical protein